jgi:hypothetical protein
MVIDTRKIQTFNEAISFVFCGLSTSNSAMAYVFGTI